MSIHLFNHRHISSRQRQDTFLRRIGNDPYVDWLLMLICFTLLLVVFIVFGFSTYRGVKVRLSAPVDTAAAGHSGTFDSQALTRVLKEFNDRTTEKGNIIQGVGISGDPSI